MNSYILDTNHLRAVFKRDQRLISRIESADAEFSTSMPCVGEMWFMVFNSSRIHSNAAEWRRVLRDLSVWRYSRKAAIEFGRIKAELRSMGRPIPDVDIQTAAIARIHNLTVLTSDRHFRFVPNLSVENWLEAQP